MFFKFKLCTEFYYFGNVVILENNSSSIFFSWKSVTNIFFSLKKNQTEKMIMLHIDFAKGLPYAINCCMFTVI